MKPVPSLSRIVVGVDGSDHAAAALGWASRLAMGLPDGRVSRGLGALSGLASIATGNGGAVGAKVEAGARHTDPGPRP